MLARHMRGTLAVCVIAAVFAASGAVDAAEPAGPEGSVAIRPHIGAMVSIAGDYDDYFNESFQGGVGVKGTFGNFGLEGSLGVIRSREDYTFSDVVDVDGELIDVSYESDMDATLGALRITGTFELNPLAGLTGHEKEGNAYLGFGFGYYPTEIADASDDVEYLGYGPHVTFGAEYFFNKTFGLFAEFQYSYIMLDAERSSYKDLDLHGVSLIGGFSLKF